MERNTRISALLEQPGTFVKWLVFAAVSGVACGGVAAAFYHAFEAVTGLRLCLFSVCLAVSYMLSGYYGLYSEQKIVYSKLRPEFIDKKANGDEEP